MSIINRAAQFSPFATLTGYDDAIQDVERQAVERDKVDKVDKVIN